MKLGTIRINGKPTVIARVADDKAVALDFPWMEDLIEAGNAGLDAAAAAIDAARSGSLPVIDLANADWMAPNPRPSKILGCAVNNNNLNQYAVKPMTAPMFEDPAFKAEVLEQRLPTHELATIEQVADAVRYLACDASGSVTGTTLKVDGGWTAW